MSIYAILHALALVFILMVGARAFAWTSPVGLSVFPALEFPSKESSILGLRLGIISEHRDVYGLDLNLLAGVTDGDFVGSEISLLYNQVNGDATIFPIQVALIGNDNRGKTTVVGLQVGWVLNSNEGTANIYGGQIAGLNLNEQGGRIVGIQVGLLNGKYKGVLEHDIIWQFSKVPSRVYGVQAGWINNSETVGGLQASAGLNVATFIYGFQVGIINRAKVVYGLQVGLVNVAESLHGLQIGLANINRGGPLKFFPILNAGF